MLIRSLLFALAIYSVVATINSAVAESTNESDCIQALGNAESYEAKLDACRCLRQVGTAAAVPALAPLLLDQAYSHPARFALENIPAPEAAAALRDALPQAPPELALGIMASIGARRDDAAVGLLTTVLGNENPAVADSAASALGRIGTLDAAKALGAHAKLAPSERRVALGEGLLAAAQALVEEDEGHEVYRILNALNPEDFPHHVVMGILEWKARAKPKIAHTALLDALQSDDPVLRDFAGRLVGEIAESPISRYTRELWKLPVDGQIALLRGLGARGDAAAEATLIAAVGSDEPMVRAAAMQALGALDTPGTIPALAEYLTPADSPESAAAYEALRISRVEGVNELLAQGLDSADPARCARILNLLTDRMAPQAVEAATRYLQGTSEMPVRVASWQALAQLGAAPELSIALQALPSVSDSEEQAAALKALIAIATHNEEAATPLLVDAVATAGAAQVPALLRTMERLGNAATLDSVLALLGNADPGVQLEAARSLSDWPSALALPHLKSLAASDDATRHALGLKGLVRLLRAEQDLNLRAQALDEAMSLARDKQERWSVLAVYGATPAPSVVTSLLPLLGDAEVGDEAAAAIVSVASELGKVEEHKALATQALDAVLEKSSREGIRARATDAKAKLGL